MTLRTFQPTVDSATTTSGVIQAVIQRARSCGEAAGASGKCAAGATDERLGIQPKLRISRPGDRYEQEADRIANQVMAPRSVPLTGPLPVTPLIQRQVEEEEEEEILQPKDSLTAGESTGCAAAWAAGAVAHGGDPLPRAARTFFEPRFGRDLNRVRIHTSGTAQAAARGIGARAYTLGRSIAFAAGEFAPNTDVGRRLLAHELTHTIQQAGEVGGSRRATPLGPISRAPVSVIQRTYDDVVTVSRLESFTDRAGAEARMGQLQSANPDREYRIVEREGNFVIQIASGGSGGSGGSGTPTGRTRRSHVCGRANTQVPDFPATYISQINVDLGNLSSGMTITWNRTTGETSALARSFPISPGAGLCNVCCNETDASRESDWLCTPKGNSQINRYRCALGSTAWARNASYFERGHSRSGIAIHSGNRGYVPSFPASHGCIRTTNQGSAVIFDNSADGRGESVQTSISISGTWAGNRCYPSESGTRRTRTLSERCGAPSSGGSGGGASGTGTGAANEAEVEPLAMGPEPQDLAGPA